LLDLELILDDLHFERVKSDSKETPEEILTKRPNDKAIERLDSAFFVCSEGVKTFMRLANFPTMFGSHPQPVDNEYRVWLMDEDGNVASTARGVIKANSQLELDFSQMNGCPPRGWFLVSCLPLSMGYYGTLRPQGLLVGDDWSSAFHLQPHNIATNNYRRLSIVIKSAKGLTHNRAFVFNPCRSKTKIVVELASRESDFFAEHHDEVSGTGLQVIEIDKVFSSIPENEILLLTVQSNLFTKKYLATVQHDGAWSADHFPTLP
jgi:hypothetical protein